MARTKQTARCAVIRNAPVTKSKIVKKSVNGRSRSRSRSISGSQQSQADLNAQQFSVKFDNQPECEKAFIQDVILACSECKAFFNSHSVITQKLNIQPSLLTRRSSRSQPLDDAKNQQAKSQQNKQWICQFCSTSNQVPISFIPPTIQNPCYLIKKAEDNKKNQTNHESMIIYCIDVSGSMDEQINNKSRLGAVRQAISDQLKRMKFEKENVRVGIIAFGTKVCLFSKKTQYVPEGLFNNFDGIVKHCEGIKDITHCVLKDFNFLKKQIQGLTTYGSTALGPGILSAIQLASHGKRGSKILLCTDGQANIGLLGTQFYNKAAKFAKQKGVMISILSLKGDHCNLKELGKLSLSTGGAIMKIDPHLLGTEFNKISKEQLLGTESILTIKVSHLFEIEGVNAEQLSADKTSLVQQYGNFTAETELTFNFKVLTKEQAAAKKVKLQLFDRPRAPMQVQLTYTSSNGASYLQVITDYRQLSSNKADAFKEMNFGLYAASALQKISKKIKEEHFDEAKDEVRRYNSLVKEVFSKSESQKELDKFGERINNLEKILDSKQKKNNCKSGIKSAQKRLFGRGRGRGSNRNKSKKIVKRSSHNLSGSDNSSESDSSVQNQDNQCLSSDGQEEVLYRQMRARSRSASRE